MSCCQCSKARQEGCPWHAAEHDPESTGFSLTLLQNWELLICAQQDAEKATGTSLAQSPPRAAPRHEAARGDTAAQPGTSPPHLRLVPLLAVDLPSNAPNLCGPAQAML